MRVSVAMAVWNAEQYVDEAVTSVLDQLGDEDELVVVDDGSTDGTLDLLLRFGDRLRLIAETHRGIGATRNRSLEACRGRYQGFVDADDRWAPGALDTLVAAIEAQPDNDVVVGRVDEFLDTAVDDPRAVGLRQPRTGVRGWFLGSMLGRRGVFERFRLDEEQPRANTVEWLTRVRHAGVNFGLVDDVVLLRRIRSGSLTSRGDDYRRELVRTLRRDLTRRRAPG